MSRIYTELDTFAQWPTDQRTRALQALIPTGLLHDAIARSALPSRFCRRLPNWFLLWFIVGLGLFARDSYRQVARQLQPARPGGTPGRSTLAMARQRLGVAPIRHLYHSVATLQAQPTTPGSFHRGYRLMALDGFVVDVPDTPENDRVFGRPKAGRGRGAYPQARVLALCEIGTHTLWRAQIKPSRRGEPTIASALLRHLQPDMLLLWDRGFFSYRLIRQVVREQKAQLLARVKADTLVLQRVRVLSDGSYISKVYPSARHRARDQDGIEVRIIEYTLSDPTRVGCQQKHRLLTTLLDEKADPAKDVVVLYHERWEEELVIDELKTHQRERPVLRSQTPGGVVQEVYALLCAHTLVRGVMVEAAKQAGVAPRRVSFVGALKILRCRLAECPPDESGRTRWYANLVTEIAEEIVPMRRNRINPRVLKKTASAWPRKRPAHANAPQPTLPFQDTVQILN